MKSNRCLLAMSMAWLLLLGAQPSHASEDSRTFDPVPLVLTGEPDADGYIQPTCSKCRRLKLERQKSVTGYVQGVLELTYFDADFPVFSGRIELVVVLVDDSRHLVSLEDVYLTNGEEAAWVIDAPSTWHWEAVEIAWMRLVPE